MLDPGGAGAGRQRRRRALGRRRRAELLAAADAAGDEPASHVHVATEDGEAFAVRHEGLAMVAVAERFTLASLMIFDMRAVLRDLARDGGLMVAEAAAHDPRSASRATRRRPRPTCAAGG